MNHSIVIFGCILLGSTGVVAQKQPASLPVLKVPRVCVSAPHALQQNGEVIRFEVRPDDYAYNGNCSQIKCDTVKASYYAFEFKPTEFTYLENEFFSIADWHLNSAVGRENIEKGWGHRSPVAINLWKDQISVLLRPLNNGELKRVQNVPLKKDWNKVEIWITWSSDPKKGKFKCVINGQKVELDNIPTLYQDNKATYFKCGIYRSGKYPGNSVMEFRNIVQGDQKLMPDFDTPPLGEGKGYKKNGIDKGLQPEKLEQRNQQRQAEIDERKESKGKSTSSEKSEKSEKSKGK